MKFNFKVATAAVVFVASLAFIFWLMVTSAMSATMTSRTLDDGVEVYVVEAYELSEGCGLVTLDEEFAKLFLAWTEGLITDNAWRINAAAHLVKSQEFTEADAIKFAEQGVTICKGPGGSARS